MLKFLEESGLLVKTICETIKNKAKKQKRIFLRMLLGTLDASLLAYLLKGKGPIRADKDTIRAEQDF